MPPTLDPLAQGLLFYQMGILKITVEPNTAFLVSPDVQEVVEPFAQPLLRRCDPMQLF